MKQKNSIAIITFHCSYNYGSVLQAYALQQFLTQYSIKVSIIDYRSSNYCQYRLIKLRSLINIKSLLNDLSKLRDNLTRKRSFKAFANKRLNLTRKYTYRDKSKMIELNNQFDVFVCGSDQIWNPVCTNGLDESFLLSFVQKGKTKIAYAPSIASDSINEETKKMFKKYLPTFDRVSVREITAAKILNPDYNNRVQVVLDPTLLLTSSDYLSIIGNKVEGSNYIFFYMLENENYNMINYVEELSKQHNLKIIYIHHNNIEQLTNARNMYGAAPDLFLELILKAKYIVTNSFHATVFSVVFRKKFCTFKTDISNSRMVDFLNSISLSSRIYSATFDMDKAIDYNTTYYQLEKLQEKSRKFIDDALEG